MSGKNKAAIIIVVVFLVFAYFLLRKPVQRALPYLGQLEQILTVYSQTEDIFAMFFDIQGEIKELKAQNKALEKGKAESNAIILELSEEVRAYALLATQANKKTDSLLGIIHEPSYEPEDFEECLGQLDTARTAISNLYLVVEEQRKQIAYLEAQNLNQALIIEQKDVIIEYQDEQLLLWRSLYETNRRRHIVITAGLVVVAYIAGAVL